MVRNAWSRFFFLGFCLLVGLWGCEERRSSSGSPAEGAPQILRIASPEDLQSTDPLHAFRSPLQREFCRQLYACLVQQDGDRMLYADLAQSWKMSKDSLQWKFVLHPEAQFHVHPKRPDDPKKVRAADVKFSLERALAQGSLHEALQRFRKALAPHDSAIVVQDDQTVLFHLAKPELDFPLFLSAPFASILPQKTVEALGELEFFKHPIGAGAFAWKDYKPGRELQLARHTSYHHLMPSGQPLPLPEGIVWGLKYNHEELVRAMEYGRIDLSTKHGPSLCLQPDSSLLFPEENIQLYSSTKNTQFFLLAQLEKKQGQNDAQKRVQYRSFRQALFGQWHRLYPCLANGWQAPFSAQLCTHNATAFAPRDSARLAAVRRLTPEADSTSLCLLTPAEKVLWPVVDSLFRAVGLRVRPQVLPLAEYRERLNAGNFSWALQRASRLHAHDANFLRQFDSHFFAPGINKTRYAHPQVDAALQKREFEKALQRLAIDLPGIPLGMEAVNVYAQPWVQGIAFRADGTLWLSHLRLQAESEDALP